MLELTRIREHKDDLIKSLKVRNIDATQDLSAVIKLDEDRRATQHQMDTELQELNALSKQIGELFKTGKATEANELKEKTASLKENSTTLKNKLQEIEEAITEILYRIPNIPNPLVPAGNSDEENEIIEEFGNVPSLFEGAVPHWELAKQYNLIDFELGVKITGAGFPVYKGKGARLQRALINFFLDEAIKAGYEEVIPPHLVNEDSGFGTGQLPDKEGQMYHCTTDNLYLIPTAEVPITNIYRNVVLKDTDFPIKNVGYTPCFRREAGSYGKDVRGLNRLHQFDKVEIVQIAHPDKSYDTLTEMVNHVKGLLDKLELPYRVARLCGGDLGFTSALTYDMEVYSAAQEKWLEVSSISNFESFQANRLKLRFKEGANKPKLAHTLNGSALALPRILASILENNQTENGVKIPKVLVPYTGFDIIN
ncbi:serine--tRNA ligase [Parvicella tangerina]|uniref:Serine--tRNA ligase n=1 Tax=Parvicella tangerina TaxID=2829795 RepID=A0A916JME3_9FLAO|nr:serine--tRNA ligase [Parvicella tangerina]CAG5079366.1 Serine--tRNA ligase [Parvicella tangerina]